MAFIIFFLFSYPSENFSFSAGISNFPGDLLGYEFCVSYHLKIDRNLSTRSTLGYTSSKYDSTLGTHKLNCEFSRLYFSQIVEKSLTGNTFLLFGAGVHSLKNWVVETNRLGSYRITDFYALNDFAPGFSIGTGIALERFELRLTYDIILINKREENLYYKRGNLHSLNLEFSYRILRL